MTSPTPNPYESSFTPVDASASPVGTPGPWRDGSFLVLHPYEANLPAICVKTGVRQGVVFDSYSMPFRSSDADYGEFTLKIDIPLSKSYSRNWLLIGLLIPLLSCLLGCSGIVFWIAENEAVSKQVISVIGIAALFLIIGGLTFGIWWCWQQPLVPVGTCRPYIWLKGACSAFLEELPQLPENLAPKR